MYIGEKEIKEHSTGPDGWEIVTFKDGSVARFPKRMYDASVSTKPEDASAYRDRRVMAVVSEVVALFLLWDLKISEIDYLFGLTSNFLNEKLDHANQKLWKKSVIERTINDINDVMTDKNAYAKSKV